ncbi:PepSY domain-containing protein [Hansschlegelia plantiphila]|uniref:PepSY domain-containing protein n=1 Tax=Hansschlegelia plantiphila TaxID=374655 RepID=A0A9W6MWL2_9HYPH|nr:PepSY domain-containing protein [Hansschlegelia plantiphila]GLK69654.1 hypothetical protein GCM10008179_32920 [Hansschlegelia plantiphila]
MKNASKIVLAAALAVGLAGPVLADPAGPGWISIEQAARKAKDAVYTEISKIEADDGRWEGAGVKNGQTLEFHIDAKTGAISNEHADD